MHACSLYILSFFSLIIVKAESNCQHLEKMTGEECVLLCCSLAQLVSSHVLSPYHEPSISWDMELQHEGTGHLVKRELLVRILEMVDNYKLSNIL